MKKTKKEIDVEFEIYKLLDKIKKEGNLEKFYEFNKKVILEYMHDMDDLDLNYLLDIIKCYGKKYTFFKKLNLFEKELIGVMLWGALGG